MNLKEMIVGGITLLFYFAVDKAYGTKDDLKAFIDECHADGIAVIIDMVLNHSFGQSPFIATLPR